MRITTKGRYAVRALLRLAINSEQKPVSIKKLAGDENLSPEFLEQIFFKLRKAEIIKSTRGPGGGFQLNHPTTEISLADIFEAVDEPMDLTPCNSCKEDAPADTCPDCLTGDLWLKVSDDTKEYFSKISLQDVLDKKL